MKKIIVSTLILLTFLNVNSQEKYVDYVILRDSAKYVQGEISYIDHNAISFRRYITEYFYDLDAAKIEEFGTKEGEFYKSVLFKEKYVFIKRIVKGNTSLYSRSGIYFYLEQDNQLILLYPESYKSTLKKYLVGNEGIDQKIDKTKYNSKSLISTITFSNSGERFNEAKVGVVTGLSRRSVVYGENDNEVQFDSQQNVLTGIYIELPMTFTSKFSTRVEVIYVEHSYSKYQENDLEFQETLLKLQTLNLPILLKYDFIRKGDLTISLEGGILLQRNFTKFPNSEITILKNSPNNVIVSRLEYPQFELGSLFGLNTNYDIKGRFGLGFGTRYQTNFNFSDPKVDSRSLQLLLFVNFKL